MVLGRIPKMTPTWVEIGCVVIQHGGNHLAAMVIILVELSTVRLLLVGLGPTELYRKMIFLDIL